MHWLGRRISDKGFPGSSPGRCTVRGDLKQFTFLPCLVLVKNRKQWMDDRPGQTVTRLEATLCLRCRPDKMDETVPHTTSTRQ